MVQYNLQRRDCFSLQGGAVMAINWKKMLLKTTFWLGTEILLNLVGLDNLADYSEFISGQEFVTFTNSVSICQCMNY
ncbi:hypothetical protein [Chroogloeocystis siderophila]|uniref:hypothetical protein n=2 Tax=Chroogloeocystis siderophila TaxID=329163 RepID=UPI0030D79130